MISIKEIKDSFLHLWFPHICAGCGSDLLNEESLLCIRCLAALPETNFQAHRANPVEKIFWGRLPLVNATAGYYFKKESLMQQLIHQFKYKGNKELGLQLGRMLAKYLMQSGRFNADALVPLPLFPVKEKKRGYNQATVLCEGMAEIMKIPVLKNAIIRPQHTETQTRKGRVERWKNMEGKFVLQDIAAINNKHLLLVDDVITTGATLEACGAELLKGENVRLSAVVLCIASN
ncbi:MAG: ComF family protein [Chitinophagaceae bacterium]|nr:ComF family protein [Chitinophagaceae bacterium]